MADSNNKDGASDRNQVNPATPDIAVLARRQALKAGLAAIPVILTLRARSAHAQEPNTNSVTASFSHASHASH